MTKEEYNKIVHLLNCGALSGIDTGRLDGKCEDVIPLEDAIAIIDVCKAETDNEIHYEKPFKSCRWEEVRSKNGTIIGLKCDGCNYRPIYDVSSRYCPNCGALMANYLNYVSH